MSSAIIRIILCSAISAVFCPGCQRQEIPQITGEVHFPIAVPRNEKLVVPRDNEKLANELGVPAEWVPPADKEHSWMAIIIHHSATELGNLAYFDKEHAGRFDDAGEHWLGIGYDFVIGNGTMSGDGQVETTFRWKQQVQGAHCKTIDNWANSYGVGIVLVGNFDQAYPTQKQMESLLKLATFLQKRYHIPRNDIYGHGQTPGGHATDCPGKNFPLTDFKQMLEQQSPGPITE